MSLSEEGLRYAEQWMNKRAQAGEWDGGFVLAPVGDGGVPADEPAVARFEADSDGVIALWVGGQRYLANKAAVMTSLLGALND
jgi:hypothetical protein